MENSIYCSSAKDTRKEYEDFRALPLAERLRKRAEGLRRQADQLKGCSWTGDRWPGSYYMDEASDLEAAAWALQNSGMRG